MADNTTLAPGAGGDTIASDDIAGVKYPRSKIVIGADGTNDGDVSAANPLPVTGTLTAVTAITNAVTVNAHAVTNAGTFAVQVDGAALTALQLLDNAISGSEMQVDVVAALPAGTNNIGDVDVLSVVPGTAATNLGKAEDAAHTTGDVGVMALAVRQDSAAAFAGTTGDYAPMQVDSLGNLRVNGAAMQSALGVNSTTTLLADGTSFEGTAEQNEYPEVMVSCFTNAPGTLFFDFSVNGADWRTFPSAGFAVAANIHEFHRALKGPRYFRVRFDDAAGTAQTVFQLYTYYGTFGMPNAPLNQALNNDSDAMAVKAVMSATNPSGTFVNIEANNFGAMQVGPEQRTSIDSMDATTGWAALGNDTINLATTTKHVTSTLALTFDKTDGAANTVFAGIEKTLSAINLGTVSQHDILATTCYLPTITDVDYVFLRLGTSASHYNEWRIPVANLTAATFQILIFKVSDANYAGITGDGWNPTAVTYCAVGAAFLAETNALAGLVFDNISFHTNLHTSAVVNSEVTTSVSSSNVNVFRVGGVATATGAGNVSTGTQRVTLANNDPAVTALQLIDNAISGSEMQVDIVAALPAGTNNIGDVDVLSLPALPAGSNNIGDVDVLSIAAGTNLVGDVGLRPRTTGGLTMHKTTSAATTNATSVKGSAGQVYNIQCFNVNAGVRYLKLYNKATAPTVGTDTPVKTLAIPGNTAGAGFVIGWPQGLAFSLGIGFALTTEATDAGTTGVALNEITVNLDYA